MKNFFKFFKMVSNKKKPSKVWSILDMIAVAIVVIGTMSDISHHKWFWLPVDALLILMWIFIIRKDWAWYPKVEDKKEDDLNKTKELRDTWKEKL
jgi:NhaP-type Na+/H+ or K+/H+ antiporter